ncbi:hypothetical protein CLU79DRAFT_261514 [Phycomyces nitens]|nr:hypothetical protein CLU79DRAFT_261514 [Phycomyces nitens]
MSLPAILPETDPNVSLTTSIAKEILKNALEKACFAVQCDAAGEVNDARDAYIEALALLVCVLPTVSGDRDRARLQIIYDLYLARLEVLQSAIGPSSDEHRLSWVTLPEEDQPNHQSTPEPMILPEPIHPLADLIHTRWARQDTFLQTPASPPVVPETCKDLRLMFALEKSILQGEFISEKLFIPKAIWTQSNIRLSSLDTKIATCETLFWNLTRLEAVSDHSNPTQSVRLLGALEKWLKILQAKLPKKLREKAKKECGETIKTRKRQSIVSWSSHRLSKSMAKVNDTFSLTSS